MLDLAAAEPRYRAEFAARRAGAPPLVYEGPIGLDGLMRSRDNGAGPVAVKGRWLDADTFEIVSQSVLDGRRQHDAPHLPRPRASRARSPPMPGTPCGFAAARPTERDPAAIIAAMETALRPEASDPEATVVRLANGVRIVAIAQAHLQSVNVSVFVRTGSSHESRRLNGISHFVEHMAFKGTLTRTCQQINLDAERLGADVNAHTDKDHTAYHMRGLAERRAALRRHARRHRPEQQLPRGRARARAPGDPARADRGRGRRAVDRRQAVRQALVRQPSDRPAGDRQPPDDPAHRPRRPARVRRAPVHRRQRRRRHRRPLRCRCRRRRRRGRVRDDAGGRRERRRGARVRGRRRLARAAGLQPDPRRPRLPDRLAARGPPRRHRRRGAVRRGHELAADGRDPRAPRPRLLRVVLGRDQRALRPVRDRGVDLAGAARRVPRSRCAACSSRRPRRSRRPSSSAPSGRSRCARCARRSGRRAGSRTPRSTCSCTAACARAPSCSARIDAVRGADVRAVFARMLATPPALAIAGRVRKGASERARALFG